MSRAIGALCIVLVLVALAAAWLAAPSDAMSQDLVRSFERPSAAHPLGTDGLGRDVAARLAAGAAASLTIALVAVLLSTLIGTVAGAAAASSPTLVDRTITALTDTALAVPRFVLLLNLAAVVHLRSALALGIVIGLTSWMRTARLVRTELLSLRERGFVHAARAAGASNVTVVVRHLMPQVGRLIGETARLRIASVILTAASLNYLGIGLPSDRPTWGRAIADGQSHLTDAPWIALPAIAMLCLTAVGLVLAGERSAEPTTR